MKFFAEFPVEFLQVEILEQFFNCRRTHADTEFFTVHIKVLTVFRFRQELLFLQRRIARIKDDI